MKMKNFSFLLCVLFAVFLSGCASLNERAKDNDIVLTLATGRVVDTLIQKSDDPAARAARVLRYATIIKGAIENDELATFNELRNKLVEQIPADKLLPGEYDLIVALVDDVVDEVRERAQQEFGDNLAGSETTLLYFLDIVIRTAQLHTKV